MDLSVIIVNYKTEKLTTDCINSVLASDLGRYTAEVVVVDNASEDGSIQAIEARFPDAKIIQNSDNLGFAKANNIGINFSVGRYVLLLNSDTVVEADTLRRSLDYIEDHPEVGALGCKVVLPDGTLDAACKRSFPTPMSSLYHMIGLDKKFPKSERFGAYNLTYLDENETAQVDCLMGAYMLVPRDVVARVGGLDEDYFMYGEDIDWCYRIHQAGFRLVYYPEVCITHYKRASGLGKRNPKVIEAFYDAMKIFFNKHYQHQYNRFLKKIIFFGTDWMKKRALKQNAERSAGND